MDGYRHEDKYFISAAGYHLLRARLRAALAPDAHAAQNRRYLVRSLYFDDYIQSGLLDKREGVQYREKFRIRYYDFDPSFIRLEAKQKHGDITRKLAAPLTREQAEALTRGDLWSLYDNSDALLRAFYLKARTRLLRPAVLVDYDREAYVFGDVRITFDHHVRTGGYRTTLFDPQTPTLPVLAPDRVILEVKYDEALPYAVRQLLRPVPATRCAISKYELCRQYQ